MVVIINTNMDVTLFFVNRNWVGYPRRVCNWVSEANSMDFINLDFNSWCLSWMEGALFLENGGCIRPCVNMMFYNGRVQT